MAVLREESSDDRLGRRKPIKEVNYDTLDRPADLASKSDGDWEVANPVNSTTGLWYEQGTNSAAENGTSYNANDAEVSDANGLLISSIA